MRQAFLLISRLNLFLLLCIFFSNFSSTQAQLNTDHVTNMGRAALSLDDYVMAIQYFNAVINTKPQQADPYFLRAHAKFSLDDIQGAESDCSTAINFNPFRSEYYELRGLCRIRREAYSEALEDYDRVLTEYPYHQTALYNKAICHFSLKDYTLADSITSLVLKRWNNFRNAYLVKSQLRLEQKDTLGGLLWIDSLLSITKREPVAWQFKGIYALSKGNYVEADSFLTQAIFYAPNRFDFFLYRAQARNALFQFDAAIADYGKVITLVPEHYVAHYNRGLLRALIGDNNQAIKDFDFVLSLEPKNTIARYNRALLREQTGDIRGAISDYTEILKEYPNFYHGYIARARCRRRIGDNRGANNDESIVARAQLDLTFAQGHRHPIRQVVRRSQLEMKDYQQLIEEDNDTARLSLAIVDALHGKVQNKRTEGNLLPAFTLALLKEKSSKHYLLEVQQFNNNFKSSDKLSLSIDNLQQKNVADILEKYEQSEELQTLDSLLFRSVLRQEMYDLEGAQRDLSKILVKDSISILVRFQEILLQTNRFFANNKKVATKIEVENPINLYDFHHILTLYDRLQKLTPLNVYVLYNRAHLYVALNRPQDAINNLTRAINIDKQFAEAYYNRGILLIDVGKTEEAISDLSRAGELGLYQAYNLIKQLQNTK